MRTRRARSALRIAGVLALVAVVTVAAWLTDSDLTVGALIVFAATGALVGWFVRRLDQLRETAERQGREANLRLQLTTRLMRGEDAYQAMDDAAHALRDVFELRGCTLRHGNEVVTAGVIDEPNVHVEAGAVVLEATTDEPLRADDHALLEALAAGLATALDRLRLEAEVREARVAAAVGQQRAGFLSAVSHNLRTPLTSVKAAASALLSSWSRLEVDERRELVELIYDESDRLERLVRNTLELSRIRAGALEAHAEPVDVADLVRHAVRRLAPISRKHLVRLHVDEALADAALDITMMEQILLNLLENALRFAPPGSEIIVAVQPIEAKRWELRVVDHGPGVPADAREHIFEEFTSVDRRPDRQGTGLGLAIVRALVTAQAGDVRCEETPGGGATFVCTFPTVGP